MSIVHTIQSIITVTRARPSKHKLHVGVAMRDYIQYNRTTSKYTHMYWHCPYQALYQPHYAVCLLLQIIVCMHALMLLYYYYSLLLYILYMIVQLACVYVPVMLVSQSLCLTALINALLLSFFRDTCMCMHLVYCTCSRESERERGEEGEEIHMYNKRKFKICMSLVPLPPPPLSLSLILTCS